jgi:hypothetical protein
VPREVGRARRLGHDQLVGHVLARILEVRGAARAARVPARPCAGPRPPSAP